MLHRRLITVPGYFAIWLLWIVAAPAWIPIALIVDLVHRSSGVALRSGGVVAVYLTCEVMGMVASGALWFWRASGRMREDDWIDAHFKLESWWATVIFRGVLFLFGLRMISEGQEALARGPYLLLVRHASAGDTLLASQYTRGADAVRLRYVLKRELLWDPCLDIVGHRLPNVFVDRFSTDSAAEVRRVQALAEGLGARDGVLIYPEGSRFSRAKLDRAIDRFEKSGNEAMVEYAKSLKFVLPPRPGGVLGLLDAAPDADVVICSHTGFEGAASLAQIWKGALLNRDLHVQFRRVSRSDIPVDRSAREQWLRAEWKQVDAYVEKHMKLGPGS